MQIFKTKLFHRWANKEGLTDECLRNAINEMEEGLIDAKLGGHVFKKRIALPGQGKSGSTRTLLAFKRGDKAFFMYGFSKNQRANIKDNELVALKQYAKAFLEYSDQELVKSRQSGALYEVEDDG